MNVLKETGAFLRYMHEKHRRPGVGVGVGVGSTTAGTGTATDNAHDGRHPFSPILLSHPLFSELVELYRQAIEPSSERSGFESYRLRLYELADLSPDTLSDLGNDLLRLLCMQQFLSR